MSSSAQVIELVGGQQVIQHPVKDAYDLIRLVRRGLPTQAIDTLLARGRLTLAELYIVGVGSDLVFCLIIFLKAKSKT